MPIDRVVVNASPLIALFHIERATLLPDLFREIVVPESVWDEVVGGGHGDPAATGLPRVPWAQRTRVEIHAQVQAWNLGDGESAVLSFALADRVYRAVVDDRAARRCARTLGIRTLGTGGILVLAKRRGLVDSVRNELGLLQQAGFWLSDSLVEQLAREAGE
jgi:predicted nucleic acid-binding protein